MLGLVCAVLVAASDAEARPKVTDFPAKGAVSAWDEGGDPTPVLVLLHGDWGYGPNDLFGVFEPAAAKRKIAVVALACPADEGCTGSFWRWNGPLTFLERALSALDQRHPIDRTRLWIAGWSGGATYLGWRTLEIERTFAGIAALGGGYTPSLTTCAETPAGVYVMSGDKNPLHAHVKNLRDYYTGCGHAVEWVLLPGADHDGEWKAIPSHLEALFDFFAKHRRVASATVPDAAVPDASVRDATVDAAPHAIVEATPSATASTRPPAMAPGACGCEVASRDDVGASSGFPLVAIAVLVRRVRRRTSLSQSLRVAQLGQACSLR